MLGPEQQLQDFDNDHSRNIMMMGQEDYDEDDFDESIDGDNVSMYSHMPSQHALSVDEDKQALDSQRSEDSDLDPHVLKLQMTKIELLPLIIYNFAFLACVLVPPLMLYEDCKSSPHYASHIVFAVLQVILLVISSFYHKRKNSASVNAQSKGAFGFDNSSSLMRSQGRCCREILSNMKLIDTYTNFCFFSLVLNQREMMKPYIFALTMLSIAITFIVKLGLTSYFTIFVLTRLGKKQTEI